MGDFFYALFYGKWYNFTIFFKKPFPRQMRQTRLLLYLKFFLFLLFFSFPYAAVILGGRYTQRLILHNPKNLQAFPNAGGFLADKACMIIYKDYMNPLEQANACITQDKSCLDAFPCSSRYFWTSFLNCSQASSCST